MPTYVMYHDYSSKGMENIREVGKHLKVRKEIYKRLGINLQMFYFVPAHRVIEVIESPDDETVTKASIWAASKGMAACEVIRAYTDPECRRVFPTVPFGK